MLKIHCEVAQRKLCVLQNLTVQNGSNDGYRPNHQLSLFSAKKTYTEKGTKKNPLELHIIKASKHENSVTKLFTITINTHFHMAHSLSCHARRHCAGALFICSLKRNPVIFIAIRALGLKSIRLAGCAENERKEPKKLQ